MVMKSLEMTDDEKYDSVMPIAMPNKPDFPSGMMICITQSEFEKLDLDPADGEVGDVFTFQATARITSKSASSNDSGDFCRVECQIEAMEVLEPGD